MASERDGCAWAAIPISRERALSSIASTTSAISSETPGPTIWGPENPVGFRMRQNLDVASGFVHGDGTAHASEGEGAHFVGNAGQDEVVFVLADPQAISGSV